MWLVLLVLVFMLLAVALTAMREIQASHKRDIAAYLGSVLSTTRQAIAGWYAQVEGEARFLASDPLVVAAAAELVTVTGGAEALRVAPAQARLRDRFAEIMTSLRYRGFFLISPDGVSLASSRDANIGTQTLLAVHEGVLARVLAGATLVTRPQASDVPLRDHAGVLRDRLPTMFVATPLHDASGRLLAILALRLDPATQLFPTLRHARIGTTGEAYLFDRHARMLSESRFVPATQAGIAAANDAALTGLELRVPSPRPGGPLGDLTVMAAHATQGRAGADLDGYLDYRGTQVLGVWDWLPQYGLGLAIEIDAAEATHDIHVGIGVMGLLVLVAVLLLIVMGWMFSRRDRQLFNMVTVRTAELRREHQRLHDEVARRSEAEERARLLLESAGEGIFGIDTRGQAVFVNEAAARMLGYPVAELLGSPIHSLVCPGGEGHGAIADGVPDFLAQAQAGTQTVETVFQTRAGQSLPVEFTATPLRGGEGEHGAVVVFSDISARRRSEASLELADMVFEHVTEGVLVTDADGVILRVNPALSAMTGYAADELVGQRPDILSSGLQDTEFYQYFWRALQTDGYWEGELVNRHKDGSAFPVWETVVAIRDGDGIRYISVARDISEQKQFQEHIHRLAYFDTLTGLPNRDLFNDRLTHAIGRTQRNGALLALMFLDLDGFKHVNDSLGHPIGDHLLRAVARRLAATVRGDDTVARLGGDEFAILLEDVSGQDQAALVAQKLVDTLREPFAVQGRQLHIGASVGISLFPEDGTDGVILLKNADAAMYRAKEKGRGSYQFFDAQMAVASGERIQMEHKLRRAIQEDELRLYYQPQYDGDGRLVGVEALVRWQDPEAGLVSPDQFIPLAEETGLIIPLGQWVLDAACRQMREWLDAGVGISRVSVNVAGPQITRGGLYECVCATLARHHLRADYLELEITETFVMHHLDEATRLLGDLQRDGIRVAIDDFGTGHSSLAALKRLPADTLKIDRAFVHDLPHDANDAAIVRAILALGHALDLHIVAEGVETAAQHAFLQAEGCDLFQGFLLGRPCPPGELKLDTAVPTCANG